MKSAMNTALKSLLSVSIALLMMVFIGFVSPAEAATIGAHLGTRHFDVHGLECFNPGLYLRHESGLTGGVYRNSYSRWSAYAGWTFETKARFFAVTVGGITGYEAQKLMPVLVPSVRLPFEEFAARIGYFPKPMKGGTSSGIHFSIERDF